MTTMTREQLAATYADAVTLLQAYERGDQDNCMAMLPALCRSAAGAAPA